MHILILEKLTSDQLSQEVVPGWFLFWRTYFSNLAFSYDRFCNILSSSFRVFGTSSLWPSKEPSFLQRLFTVLFLV